MGGEATVDGQPAGRITFEVAPAGGAAAPAPPLRRIMDQAQLFARVSGAFVVLERASAKGRRLDPAAAVAVGHGRLLTSMAAVDGADAITAVTSDGKRTPLTTILGMNRSRDWIVLAGGTEGDAAEPIAAEGSIQVGDRCYTVAASTNGTRVLVDGAISGRGGTPASGPRLIANLAGGSATPGSPVFSEFGELIGFVGGSLVPGTSDLSDLIHFRAELRGEPVVPVSLVSPTATPTSFADVWARGDIVHALEGREHVLSGGFAKGMLKDITVRPTDQRDVFSPSDKEFLAFVTWGPQARLKGTIVLRVYNEANQMLAESKAMKLDVRPGVSSMLSSWRMAVPPTIGVYRADVLLDGTPIWRGFVRVAD